jgi:PilZ domain-containing protein
MSMREAISVETSQTTILERRTYVRLASDLEATCCSVGVAREVGWPGRVRDISRGGIGLALTHCFHAGTDLAVELRDQSGALRRIVRVRVVHATAASIEGNICWLLGCSFDAPLTEEEFQALQ